ncbi:hypothetical protein Tco_1507755 [Tanacetum coccineum]
MVTSNYKSLNKSEGITSTQGKGVFGEMSSRIMVTQIFLETTKIRLMYMEIYQDYYLIIVLSSKHLFSSGYAKVPCSPTPTAFRAPKSDSEIRQKPLGQGSDVAEGLFSVQECSYRCLPVIRVLCGMERRFQTSYLLNIILRRSKSTILLKNGA